MSEAISQCVADVNIQDEHGDTQLHLAIGRDAGLDRLKTLLELGARLDLTNEDGNTPLECLKHGSVETALNLLKLEKYFDFRDIDGSTVLHMLMDRLGDNVWGIIRPDDMEVGIMDNNEQDRLILLFWDGILQDRDAFNIDLNTQDKYGGTPLHVAANFWPSSKHLEIILTEFDHIKPSIQNRNGDNFLHVYFTKYGIHDGTDLDNRLLRGELSNIPKKNLKILLNCRNESMNTPIHELIKDPENVINTAILLKVIGAGADINIRDNVGETALHCLLRDYLLDNDDDDDDTEERRANNVRCMILNGADINARNNIGDSPIFLAQHKKTVNAFLDLGADVNIRNRLQQTPLLSILCKSGTDLELVKLFLNGGSDVNVSDIQCSNILHYVAWHGLHPDIVSILKTHNVKVLPDNIGQLPCQIAYLRGNKQLFDVLCKCDKSMHEHTEHFKFQKEIIDISNLVEHPHYIEDIYKRFYFYQGRKIVDILTLPGFGLVAMEGEAKLIKTVVTEIVTEICKKITERNKFLSTNLIQSGSVGENTKVGLPDEFDFICIFDQLGDMCVIDEQKSSSDPGFAYMRLNKEGCDSACGELFDQDGYIDTFKVRAIVDDVFQDIFKSRDIFRHPFVSFVDEYFKGANCPTFHFAIRWVGCMFKDLNIDIDLVPACQKRGWWPEHVNIDSLYCDVGTLKNEGAVLMLQTDLDEDYKPFSKQRISANKAEKSHMVSIPKIARDAYIVSKVLCNSKICPSVRATRKINVEAKDVLTSYMLKNCMFAVLHTRDKYRSSQHAGYKDTYSGDELYEFVLQVFCTLLMFCRNGNLPSFMFPWQNIFTFDLKSDTPASHNYACARRYAFVKTILTILGDLQDFTDIDQDAWSDRLMPEDTDDEDDEDTERAEISD